MTAAWSFPNPRTPAASTGSTRTASALCAPGEGVWDQALTDFHKAAEQTHADNRFAGGGGRRRLVTPATLLA